jgi:hypothetical protein
MDAFEEEFAEKKNEPDTISYQSEKLMVKINQELESICCETSYCQFLTFISILHLSCNECIKFLNSNYEVLELESDLLSEHNDCERIRNRIDFLKFFIKHERINMSTCT